MDDQPVWLPTPVGLLLAQPYHQETNKVLPETNKGITAAEMQQLLKDYYEVQGWDEPGQPPSYRGLSHRIEARRGIFAGTKD
jgi:aldehyde:ferredoxin oxidoreductase